MKTILIIEDTDFISENIATTLKFEGYSTIIAEDGIRGLERLRTSQPDLILCDVSMPRMDGFGVLRELRKMKEVVSTTPFIFLTAKAEKADMRRGMELGADDYLTKPFTTVELINAVNTQLAKKEKVEQHYEEKLDELRGNITYALPHEFRTALNGILGFSDIIINATANVNGAMIDPNEINDLARSIKESGRRLHKLTENFLVYTQIQILSSKPEELEELRNFAVENVGEILRDTAHSFAHQFERVNDLHCEVAVGDVQMSSENFVKIINELLDNSFRFSEPGSIVRVTAHNDERDYTIVIKDIGRGMTAEQLANIGAYNQFRRDMYEQQGAGLGLTISKLLTEIHGGAFTIDSELEVGTTVTVVLPVVV